MIAITIDMDWAPDAVIEDGLKLLDDAGARATIFATHKTTVLDGLDPARFEIALHPNYLKLMNGEDTDRRRPLQELLDLYPDARGIRTHGLVQSAALHGEWAAAGLRYESHQYFPAQVPVFFDFSDLYRVPVYWSDSREIYLPHPLEVANLRYEPALPAVFVFHFVHLFLNTERGERYQAAKPDYHDPARLAAHRNTGPRKGARDFLADLLERAKASAQGTLLCRDLVDACEDDCGGVPASVMVAR